MKNNELTIIIPTLNEEENIKPLIEEIFHYLPDSLIIVVDDNSSDNTSKIVEEMLLGSSQIRLINRKYKKPCLTKSIEEGVYASITDYVAWMDADFSHPPEVLKELYRNAKSTLCCIATRYSDVNNNNKNNLIQNDSMLSSILSSILNFFIFKLLNLNISDYTSGFIVCKRDLIKSHKFIGDYGEYFIELMYYLHNLGINIIEIPFISPPRKYGESKTGSNLLKLICRGIKYILMVIRLIIKKLLVYNG